MSRNRLIVLSTAAVLLPGALMAQNSQDAEHSWSKSYAVTGKPVLTIDTADGNLDVHACGDCRAVQIHVESGRKLSEYRLEESQSGNQIHFSFKEKPHYGMGIHWNSSEHGPRISVETPAALTLDAKTADGNLVLRDLNGDLKVHSGDGNVDIHNSAGALEAGTSDGRVTVDGKFTGVQLHTSDGNVELALADGSQLSSASRVESSDGQVKIRLPRELAADLDVSTSDGKIDCSLPLTVDHYNSHGGDSNHLHGKLNAGSTPLAIHTSDGNVTISSL